MNRALLTCLALCAGAYSAALADPLSGPQLRANLTGSKIVGLSVIGTPYTVSLKPNGLLQGVQGTMNQFDDHGRWWISDDKLCVQWELWLFAKPTCYRVELEGDTIYRYDVETNDVTKSTLVRHGQKRKQDPRDALLNRLR